jgi:NADP-dependent 3-hydroxy acid dehydrogenase YdfG
MGLLEGKIAFVTDAGTGAGRETAILLAQEGAMVVLTGRRLAQLEDVAEAIKKGGGKSFCRVLDAASYDDILEAVASVKAVVGTIDILVNNPDRADKILNAPSISEAEWNTAVNLDLTAVFNVTRAVLEDMIARTDGTIITVSALSIVNPNVLSGAAHSAARAGVETLMTSLHNTYWSQGIRATTILPRETGTPITNNRARPPAGGERAAMLNPHDVARAVLLCASLQKGTMVRELHICPTFVPDTSADIEVADWIGTAAGLRDKPKRK